MVYYQFTPDVYFTNLLVKRGFLHLHSDRLRVWQDLTQPSWHQLHDGLLMEDAEEFIEYLHLLIIEKVGIAIIPDYDTDGICSGTVLYQSLLLLGCENVYLYTPSMSDGYGLSKKSIDDCLDNVPFELGAIITTDNGIKAFEGIDYAKSKGLIVLVSDHHIGDETSEPIADVIVDPNRKLKIDSYPYSNISGTTVIWKLLVAYAMKYSSVFVQQAIFDLFLFVGLSVISDVMPLEDENRTFVQFTCQFLSNRQWLWQHVYDVHYPLSYRLCFLGILALLDTLIATDKISEVVTSDDLGYYLSPLLNTPRRIEASSERAFRLFNSSAFDLNFEPTVMTLNDLQLNLEEIHFSDSQRDYYQAFSQSDAMSYYEKAILAILTHAKQLYAMNQMRKEVLDVVVKRVQQNIKVEYISDLIHQTVQQVPINHGLVGLIAGRLMNQYRLPFIVFGDVHHGLLSGSARSSEQFHIYSLLQLLEKRYPDLIQTWGGHAQAAGITIYADRFKLFQQAFSECLVEDILHKYGSLEQFQYIQKNFIPKTREYFIWCENIPNHWFSVAQNSVFDWYDVKNTENDIFLSFVSMLRMLEPFGQGFSHPDFAFTFSLSKYDYERQFKLIGKEKNHSKLTLYNHVNVALDCLTWRTGEKLRYMFDQHFINHDIYTGIVSGQLSVNEFRGNYTLQLLNANFSENF